METTRELSNTDVLRECLADVPTIQDAKHQSHVAEALGVRTASTQVAKAQSLGFTMFVREEEVRERFKYHAGVNGSYIISEPSRGWVFNTIWSLLTIGLAVGLGLSVSRWGFLSFLLLVVPLCYSVEKPVFTKRFAVDYVGDLPEFILERMRSAPWNGTQKPRFTIHSMNPLPVERQRLFERVEPIMVWWLDDDLGAVVGVWDNDTELEL